MSRVLCVAPHPDDETLGCGGTLLKHQAQGDETVWLIVTNMHEKLGYTPQQIKKRDAEIEAVAQAYQFRKVIKFDYLTTELDTVPNKELVSRFQDVFRDFKPELLYLPGRMDAHSDHRRTFQAAMSAAKVFRCPSLRKILMYEVISETDALGQFQDTMFVPQVFTDISEMFEKKCEIFQMFDGEGGEHPFPRSLDNIRALAIQRGAMAGVKYAECFQLIKEIC